LFFDVEHGLFGGTGCVFYLEALLPERENKNQINEIKKQEFIICLPNIIFSLYE